MLKAFAGVILLIVSAATSTSASAQTIEPQLIYGVLLQREMVVVTAQCRSQIPLPDKMYSLSVDSSGTLYKGSIQRFRPDPSAPCVEGLLPMREAIGGVGCTVNGPTGGTDSAVVSGVCRGGREAMLNASAEIIESFLALHE